MKPLTLLSIGFVLCAGMAQAACYADYKAKQDNPLRLHYGVAEIRGECSAAAAARELRSRLSRDNWELLNVMSVFEDEGLARRRGEAGEYYLRY